MDSISTGAGPSEIENIKLALQKGNLVLFVGAGLSMGAGLPGWLAIARPLANAIGYRLPNEAKFITTDHLLTAAQYYENQRGRTALIQQLRNTLDTTDKRPTSVHRLIASLPLHVIFTTNYDDFIEQALRESGKRYNVVVATQDLAFWSEDQVQIIKLCGDLTRPESIIFSKRDFNTYFANRQRLAERLRTMLESKTALFLGYSLQDPFFNQIWENIGLDFGKYRHLGYTAMFDVERLEIDDLRQRSIHVIGLAGQGGTNRNQILENWLQEIAVPPNRKASSIRTSDIKLGDSTVRATVLLEGDYQKFTEVEQNNFVLGLSYVLNVTPGQIRILRVAPGSVIVTLEMPEQTYSLLLSKYIANDTLLQSLRITKIQFERINVLSQGEKAVVGKVAELKPSGQTYSSHKAQPVRHLCIYLEQTNDQDEDMHRMREIFRVLTSIPGQDRFTFFVSNPQGTVQLDFPNFTTHYGAVQEILNEMISEWGSLEVQ